MELMKFINELCLFDLSRPFNGLYSLQLLGIRIKKRNNVSLRIQLKHAQPILENARVFN